jgi:hypothetical protein
MKRIKVRGGLTYIFLLFGFWSIGVAIQMLWRYGTNETISVVTMAANSCVLMLIGMEIEKRFEVRT